MDNRFTENANAALMEAQKFAWSHNQVSIGTEHIIIGLLRERRGVACRILEENGVDIDVLLRLTDQVLTDEGGVVTRSRGTYTPRAADALNNAVKEAERYGQDRAEYVPFQLYPARTSQPL